jgi:uncharacterized protein YcfJ
MSNAPYRELNVQELEAVAGGGYGSVIGGAIGAAVGGLVGAAVSTLSAGTLSVPLTSIGAGLGGSEFDK